MKCRSKDRQQIRLRWLKALEEFLSNKHTPGQVKTSIVNHMTYWLEPMEKRENQTELHSTDCRGTKKAEKNQETIGWRHSIRGKMLLKWGDIIHTHLAAHNIKSITAEKWGSKILEINWTYILQMWALRNKQLQGSTTADQI
jgi:hypothetical protein